MAVPALRAAPLLTGIEVTPMDLTVEAGETVGFAATGVYDDGSHRGLGGWPVVAVEASDSASCALLADGSVQCFGVNFGGQLGGGATGDSLVPVRVVGLNGIVTELASGQYHYCALLSDGRVQCWGTNFRGQLGDGTLVDSLHAVTVSGISTATSVVAGAHHSCALLADGSVKCWGGAGSNPPEYVTRLLGDGSGQGSLTPKTVLGITTATALAASWAHTCALLASTEVKCWGDNGFGQLGHDTTPLAYANAPVTVDGLQGVEAITTGGLHTCALLTTGAVECWGRNALGALGNASVADFSTSPVPVEDLPLARQVAAGLYHTCALLRSGGMRCWGSNQYGELGTGGSVWLSSTTPVSPLVTTPTAMGVGWWHTCAVLEDGVLQCWGKSGVNTRWQWPESVRAGPSVAVWTSGDPSVALIDSIGLATALRGGRTLISVTANGVKGNTWLTVNGAGAALSDLKLTGWDSTDPVVLGETVVYTMRVTNNGPATATRVRLNDLLPTGVQLLSVVPSKGACNVLDLVKVKCWLGHLPGGASAKVVITVRPLSTGRIATYATGYSDEVDDPNMGDNNVVIKTRVVAPGD
jgi:uncharacterized repeat protein (TIGR01451 family)